MLFQQKQLKIWQINNLNDYEVFGSPESYHLKEMYLILNQSNKKVYALEDRKDALIKDKTRTQELVRLLDSLEIYYKQIDNFKYTNLKKFIKKAALLFILKID